ncbi:hypothetical protein CLU79DRAFT_739105 [Phycomyces nitens]|nr:hypothetical protein CLU79DRAFT_739105 [Phycomyces nitens]
MSLSCHLLLNLRAKMMSQSLILRPFLVSRATLLMFLIVYPCIFLSSLGHGLNSDIMPKRPWGGYSFVNFTSSRDTPAPHSQRRIRSPKMRSKSSIVNQTPKSPTDTFTWAHPAEHVDRNAFKDNQGLDGYVPLSSQDLATSSSSENKLEMDDLVAMLKNHRVSEAGPTGTIQDDRQTANIPLVSFNFSFNDRSHKIDNPNILTTSLAQQTNTLPSTSSPTFQPGPAVPPAAKPQSGTNMPLDYKFSFSANIPCQQDALDLKSYEAPRTTVYIRPLAATANQTKSISSTDHVPHPLSQIAFPTENHGPDGFVSGEKERKMMSSNDPNLAHLQHRRILPMPKPSHKRRAVKKESLATSTQVPNNPPPPETATFTKSVPSPTGPPVWEFKAQINDAIVSTYNTKAIGQRENWGADPTAIFSGTNNAQSGFQYEKLEPQQPTGSPDAVYREKTKKMKRSVANDSEIENDNDKDRKEAWRKDRGRKAGEDDSANLDGRFFERAFDFSIDEKTREKWNKLPENEEMAPLRRSIGLTEVLKQTKAPKAMPAISQSSKTTENPQVDSASIVNDSVGPIPSPPPRKGKKASNTNKKKKGKQTGSSAQTPRVESPDIIAGVKQPSTASKPSVPHATKLNNSASTPTETTASGKKGKKNQRKKNQDDQGPTSGYDLFSEVSVIRNANPDDWTCLFCQFEIFCNGIEVARRKGGFYRRRRERQRKLKETETKRNGEAVGKPQSDDEDRVGGINNEHVVYPKKPLGPVPLTSIPTSTAEAGSTRHLRRNHLT